MADLIIALRDDEPIGVVMALADKLDTFMEVTEAEADNALLSAPVVSPPQESTGAPLDGYCAICYHPLDACRHCDGEK